MLKPSWVEIPATNLERAMAFYQAVFALLPTEVLADEVRRITILATPTPEGRAGVSLNQTRLSLTIRSRIWYTESYLP